MDTTRRFLTSMGLPAGDANDLPWICSSATSQKPLHRPLALTDLHYQ